MALHCSRDVITSHSASIAGNNMKKSKILKDSRKVKREKMKAVPDSCVDDSYLQDMEVEEVEKSLWHAFDVLDKSSQVRMVRTSKVHKSKLKVLTNNLGHIMHVDHAETIWDKVKEDVIDFEHFMMVLNSNLLVGLDKTGETSATNLRVEVDNLCWMLCENSYRQRIRSISRTDDNETPEINNKEREKTPEPADAVYENMTESKRRGSIKKKHSEFSSTDCFKLWKIFNFLCERTEDNKVMFPLRVDMEEAERIVSEICQTVGLEVPKTTAPILRVISNDSDEPIDGSTSASSSISSVQSLNGDSKSFLMDFTDYVDFVVQRLMDANEDLTIISHGISEVYSQIVSDTVRKGTMVKFGNKVTAWKERWFVLTASALRYYLTSEEKDLKGSIILCPECFTQSFPDKPGGKHHRFKLHTPNKQYELSAPSLKAKNEWMADLRKVFNAVGKSKESLQRENWRERKKGREERRRRTAEEELRRCAEREKLLDREKQLEEEKKQRQLALEEVKERERLLQLERQKRAEEEEKRRQETTELLEEKRKEIEEEKRRFAEIEDRLQKERESLVIQSMVALEAEREQRVLVEERLREEEAQLEAERRRLKELEEAKGALEALVEEERALKRDEEIVRGLQAKILEEEIAKREELERLQAEQGVKLKLEQLSRMELEEIQKQQEEDLRLAQEQLDALIQERKQADQELQEAENKLKQAESDRLVMEGRMKLKDMSSSKRLGGPLPKRNPDPFVTHRGLGAFVEADFVKYPAHDDQTPESDVGLVASDALNGLNTNAVEPEDQVVKVEPGGQKVEGESQKVERDDSEV